MKTSRGKKAKTKTVPSMVDFRFKDIEYQIDPERRRVYRDWVTVESAKTFIIFSAWFQVHQQKV